MNNDNNNNNNNYSQPTSPSTLEDNLPPQFSETDKYFMQQALLEAQKALEIGEVPVGCVIVREGEIIARGHNQTVKLCNATKHAEFIAIQNLLTPSSACSEQQQQQQPQTIDMVTNEDSQNSSDECHQKDLLKGCYLYVTVEPCLMCAWALRLLSLTHVYFGASNPRFGGCGSVFSLHDPIVISEHEVKQCDSSCFNMTGGYTSSSGLLEEEAIHILKTFYDQENLNAPLGKRKIKPK